MQQLDTGQQGGQELVDYAGLEGVPELTRELIVDGDAVLLSAEGRLLDPPEICLAPDPHKNHCRLGLGSSIHLVV